MALFQSAKGLNKTKTVSKKEGILPANAFTLELQLFPDSLTCQPTPSDFGFTKLLQSFHQCLF